MEQPPPVANVPSPENPPSEQSLAGRLVNVFADPGEVFAEVRRSPVRTANWLAPALVYIAAAWASVAIIFSQDVFRQQVGDMAEKGLEKSIEQKHIPNDQADKIREATRKYAPMGAIIFGTVTVVVLGIGDPFFWGFILWLGGAKIFKGNFPYMKAAEAAGLVAMIGVLDIAVRTLIVFAKGNFMAAANAALFLAEFDPQNPWHTLLKDLDVMTFWMLALRSVALARLSSVSIAKAAAWVCGAWTSYTVLGVGYAALAQALSQMAQKH